MLVGIECERQRAEVVASEAFATIVTGALAEGDGGETLAETTRALASLAPFDVSDADRELLSARVKEFSEGRACSACEATAIKIGFDALGLVTPGEIERALVGVPFRFSPGLAKGMVSMEQLLEEVQFKTEQLVTANGMRVDERRQTCWMAEEGVGGLAYSGKIMAPAPMAPCVVAVRDALEKETGERFDCCLINMYANGDVACSYHQDPDHGRLWATDSIIVSIGETRRFTFRPVGSKDEEVHWVRVRDGDCVRMFSHCNTPTTGYEHSVMKAEGHSDCAPRASIVFKRSLPHSGGKRGHGLTGTGRRAAKSKATMNGAKTATRIGTKSATSGGAAKPMTRSKPRKGSSA